MRKKTIEAIKVFCFMVTAHELLLLLKDGTQLNRINVDSEAEAHEILLMESTNQSIADKLESTNFSTIWVDDPAGDEEVMDACRLMEEKGLIEEKVEEVTTEPIGEISVRTVGTIFNCVSEDTPPFVCDGEQLKIGDRCEFRAPDDKPDGKLWVVTREAERVSDTEEAEGFYVFLTECKPDEVQEPKIKENDTGKKVIEVECEMTPSEEHIRMLIRRLRSIKAEALESASNYREDVKAAEKALFEAEAGKAYTNVECDVVNDYASRERKYINSKTGVVVKVERIPDEEAILQEDMSEELLETKQDEAPEVEEDAELLDDSDPPEEPEVPLMGDETAEAA